MLKCKTLRGDCDADQRQILINSVKFKYQKAALFKFSLLLVGKTTNIRFVSFCRKIEILLNGFINRNPTSFLRIHAMQAHHMQPIAHTRTRIIRTFKHCTPEIYFLPG